ncbi:rCG32005 [Rattus norvegicus]|uniref:RCG32005 n=1 Tax=Rattus norvegicus TaxID=10116 RepID=A6KDR1_RAT|nr:rCG32005 [Rattus norvegicus]
MTLVCPAVFTAALKAQVVTAVCSVTWIYLLHIFIVTTWPLSVWLSECPVDICIP